MSKDDNAAFTVSDNAVQIFQLNPGLNLSSADLQAINQGALIPVGPGKVATPNGGVKNFGCITRLRYQTGDNDLRRVEFGSGETLQGGSQVANLNDFRDTFQTAANFGFGISGCLNTKTKELSMVNLTPCRCQCTDGD